MMYDLKLRYIILLQMLTLTTLPTAAVEKISVIGEWENQLAQFHSIQEGEIILVEFQLKNTTGAPVEIIETNASCSCTVLEYPKKPVLADEVGLIEMQIETEGFFGPSVKTARLIDSNGRILELAAQGNIEGMYPRKVDFGVFLKGENVQRKLVIEKPHPHIGQTITLHRSSGQTKAVSTVSQASASEGVVYVFETNTDVEYGKFDEEVDVQADNRSIGKIHLVGEVLQPVVLEESRINLGGIDRNHPREAQLLLYSPYGYDFKVLETRSKHALTELSVDDSPSGRRKISVIPKTSTLTENQASRVFRDELIIRVEVMGEERELNAEVLGLLKLK